MGNINFREKPFYLDEEGIQWVKSTFENMTLDEKCGNAKYILERVGLLDAFDAISDGTNISKSKPDPEVFLKGAEFLGVEPSECVVVEDAFAGIDAAKAGNMMAAGIGDARDYDKTDYRLDTFSDLLRIGIE